VNKVTLTLEFSDDTFTSPEDEAKLVLNARKYKDACLDLAYIHELWDSDSKITRAELKKAIDNSLESNGFTLNQLL
jgi:hypothetical protein